MFLDIPREDSDDVFRRVLHAMSEATAVHRDGLLLEVNDAFARMHGFDTPEQAAGTSLLSLAAPGARARVATHLVDHPDELLEYECTRHDGTSITIRSRSTDITFEGRAARVVTEIDVTEEVRATDRLDQADKFIRVAFHGAPIGMAILSPDGRILRANSALSHMLGFPISELVQMSYDDITHPDDIGHGRQFAVQTLEGRISGYRVEKRYLHAGGHVIWVQIAVSLVRTRDGEPRYFIAQLEDITERKRIEAALLRETATVRLLQTVAVAANASEEPADVYRTALAAVCAHTGWPVGHVYRRSADGGTLESSQIWHLDDPDRYRPFCAATVPTVTMSAIARPHHVFETGLPTWFDDYTRMRPSRSAAAHQVGLRAGLALPVLVGTDIAAMLEFFTPDTARPDDALLDILGSVGTQVGRVVERARLQEQRVELDMSRARFVANAAHELRTPLATLRTIAGLLGSRHDEMAPQEIAECCELLERQGCNLDSLVDDLLDLARIEHGDLSGATERIRVEQWVDDALATAYAPEAMDVIVDLAPDLCVVGDPTRLHRALVNLLANAYLHGGTPVAVRASAANGIVTLAVDDGGPGVPESFVPHLFEPFTRSGGGAAGAGLGLAIVRTVVEQFDGSVTYEPGPDGGARFVVRLPEAL